MTCANHLRDNGHSDHIAANNLHHADFCRRFEVRTRIRNKYAFSEGESLLCRNGLKHGAIICVISISQREEAIAITIIVWPHHRRTGHRINVIAKRNQATRPHFRTQRSCRIGAEQHFTAQ
ncbi:Uncharacterised protein [Salmonella enterica subsp. enterica serovar Typhi]|nr:Uncharacterised protein [Salmonella enterica subsp. enterica serovar Typhi]